jgi:hypothetical protein
MSSVREFRAMATEKQVAANRANAERSTDPKNTMGRLKSSLNAFQRGLSWPLDMTISAKVDVMARTFAGEGASDANLISATELAQAKMDLFRIGKVRVEIMEAMYTAFADPQERPRRSTGWPPRQEATGVA